MFLTGGSVIARRHMRGLDKVRDVEAKLVRSGFLGEATTHGGKIRARSDGASHRIRLLFAFK
jgi:hypothetical protein